MLTQYFRKAYRLRQEEVNHNAWLQGMYIYDAVSTALYNGFKRKNDPKKDYANKPYDFNKKEITEKEVQVEKAKAVSWMENFVRVNKKRARAKKEPEPIEKEVIAHDNRPT